MSSKYVAEFEPTVDPDLAYEEGIVPADSQVDAFTYSNVAGQTNEEVDAEIAEMEEALMADPEPPAAAKEQTTGAVNAMAAQLRIAERERAEMSAIIKQAKAREQRAVRARAAEQKAAEEKIPSAQENPQGHIIGSLKKIQGRLDRDSEIQDNEDRTRLHKGEMEAATVKAGLRRQGWSGRVRLSTGPPVQVHRH